MAGNGTSSHFEEVYDRYAAVMYGCILKIVKEKDRADLVLRNVFLDLSKSTFEKELPQVSWFIKFAMQKAFQFLKTNHPSLYTKALSDVSAGAFLQR